MILYTLVIGVAVVCNFATKGIEQSTGAYFLDQGSVTITQSSWGLIVEMRMDAIDNCLIQLQEEIKDLLTHPWPLVLTALEGQFLDGIARLVNVSSFMFSDKTRQLQRQSEDIQNLLTGRTRQERALFNSTKSEQTAGKPSAFAHLFNMATFKDILRLQTSIKGLIENELIFADAWQETVKVLNDTHLLSNINKLMIANLTDIAHKLRGVVNAEHRRQSRSIAPGLGDLLRSLAGTATVKEVEQIRQRLGLIHQTQQKMQHIVEQSVTLINVTHLQAQANEAYIKQLQEDTEILRRTINNLTLRFETYQQISSAEVLIVVEVLSMMNKISHTVQTVTQSIQAIMESLSALINGKLPPTLIGPSEFTEILTHIDQQLPIGLSLPASPTKNILFYYDMSSVLILPAAHGYSILIILPLRPDGDQYNIYRVIPIPIQLPNSLSYIYFDLEYQYLAVSTDRTKYFYPQPKHIDTCLQHKRDICKIQSPLYVLNDVDCMTALFNRNTGVALLRCNRRVKIFDKPKTVVTYLEDGVWLLNPFKEERLVITCPNLSGEEFTSRVEKLTVPKVVTLHRGCAAHAATFFLPRFYRQTTKIVPKVTFEDLHSEVSSNLFFEDLKALSNITGSSNSLIPSFVIPDKVGHVGEIDVSMRDLTSAIKHNRQLLSSYDDLVTNDEYTYSHVGFIRRNWLLVTCIIISSVIAIALYCWRRRRAVGDDFWKFWQRPAERPIILPTALPTHTQEHIPMRELSSTFGQTLSHAQLRQELSKEETV